MRIEVNSIAPLAPRADAMTAAWPRAYIRKSSGRGKQQRRSLRMRTVSDNNIVAELDCYI